MMVCCPAALGIASSSWYTQGEIVDSVYQIIDSKILTVDSNFMDCDSIDSWLFFPLTVSITAVLCDPYEIRLQQAPEPSNII